MGRATEVFHLNFEVLRKCIFATFTEINFTSCQCNVLMKRFQLTP